MRIKAVWFRTAVFHAAAKVVEVLTGKKPKSRRRRRRDKEQRNRHIDAPSPPRGARGAVERQSRRRNSLPQLRCGSAGVSGLKPLTSYVYLSVFNLDSFFYIEALSAVRWLNVIKRKKDRDMETEIKKLKPVELWILLVLKAAGGEVCCKTKIMKILFLLERVYGIIGVKFEPYNYGPWSKDVEDALRRLVELGLVEERELPKPQDGPEHTGLMYLYRLTEKGRRAVEKIPLKDPKWRVPYAAVRFFVGWDVRDLMEYIYVNYPEYAVNSVIKDKLARKAEV
ncbi:MAG: hypothetical protein GU356_04310 [Pyrobaculum sp.]|jgi:hypothetical protein|nr:hypothetical protein [Pyrobaculum sp.]